MTDTPPLLSEAVSSAAKRAAPDVQAFADALYRNVSPQDLAGYTPDYLVELARQVWSRANAVPAGGSLVDVFDPRETASECTHKDMVLIAVNDDMPFLFDSVMNEVAAQAVRLVAAFHPIVPVAGRNASVIVLLLNPVSGPERYRALISGIETALAEVRVAVRDRTAMETRLGEAIDWLRTMPLAIPAEEAKESFAFLSWLYGHFTFLGCRDYGFSDAGDGCGARVDPLPGSGLGVLADTSRRIVRRDSEGRGLSADVRDFLAGPTPVIIAKSNEKSLVHRRANMDYIGVKSFDANGVLKGERRFVGLFTSGAYSLRPFDIPLLRLKVRRVVARAGLPRGGHDAKTLIHIIDSFPRDELFQIGEAELFRTAMGILQLGGRPLVRVFPRFDSFNRFASAIVYVPRDRYSSEAAGKIHAVLARHFDGRITLAQTSLDETALARIYCIIGRDAGPLPEVDVSRLEADIRRILYNWDDGFADALRARFGDETDRVYGGQAQGFPAHYRDAFRPGEAVEDLVRLEKLSDGKLECRIWRREDDAPDLLRLKLYGLGETLPLSQSLPVIENFGLKAISENAYPVTLRTQTSSRDAFVLDFETECLAAGVSLDGIRSSLETALDAALAGDIENDGINRLVIAAGLSGREAMVLRAIARYLRQAAVPFSLHYMEQALVRNAAIAKLLIDCFHARCNPDGADEARAADLHAGIDAALAEVQSLDDDRILRRFRNVVECILRTNYYQPDADGAHKAHLSFKLDSRKLTDLPAPRPLVEIFVYSPEVEGVHLRFGRVARGGLRWSDRREDFRTEILGLVKAQQVKNAVIVPMGSKGGFYPKHLPAGPRDAVMAAGISAYRVFINGILDLTDNLDAAGAVTPPPHVLRHDGDDPYLVVAADKGTASFSDIANAIAIERGFWLGDAFASGGSHGYDHKKMGITARGAWEAVKRHFREMGRDIQREPFTCIGVGDMSGDVFGNGMLCSRCTRLLAAFDHRHIFVDPDPDAEASWKERKRLFDLPRSSWADYNEKLISAGGGVFPRTAKSIPLSAQMKALTGLGADAVTPNEFIRALLKSEADLLFFGGIGTFVKATGQDTRAAGDRANDAVRIDGAELKVRVVGEGANLGLTQAGRIEAAQHGVRLNTDAIDNSAGVDTSDHEVNLKILLGGPYIRGEIDGAARDALLAQMTDEVAALVLRDNYDQTLALSVAEARAPVDLDAHGRFMQALEARGHLSRAVEVLPDDAELARRGQKGLGLTRPELAVLLAYAKLDLKGELLAGSLPDDPGVADELTDYFPPEAVAHYPEEAARHRLKREIIASSVVNRMVNICGPVFVSRLQQISGASAERIVRGYLCAERIFSVRDLKARIDALDGRMEPAAQIAMYDLIGDTLRRLALWFVVNVPEGASLTDTAEMYRTGVDALRGTFAGLVSKVEAADVGARIAAFQEAGAPFGTADAVGALPLMSAAPEIVFLARLKSLDLDLTAGAYFAAGRAVGIDRLRVAASRLAGSDHWDRLAIRRIGDDLYAAERQLAAAALTAHPSGTGREDGVKSVEAWAAARAEPIARVTAFLNALEKGGPMTVAKLTLAGSQIRELAGL